MTTAIPRRGFITLGSGQLHYRIVGTGPAVVLEHSGPHSSRVWEPLMSKLADHYTVIAFDRPGFGDSDLLDIEVPHIEDYAEALLFGLTALGVDKMVLHGQSTGSLVALELARKYPERVVMLSINNLPFWTRAERDRHIAVFPPQVVPLWDGSHLLHAWSFARDAAGFFPWFERGLANWRDIDFPAVEQTNETALGALIAGPAGALGFQAVGYYETVEALQELAVPTKIIGREGEVAFHLLPRIPDGEGRYEIVRLPRDEPPGELERFIRAAPAGTVVPATKPGLAATPPGQLGRSYVNVADGQLLVRSISGGTGRPLVLLPRNGRSSGSLVELMKALAADRPVIAVDLPGLGGSDVLRTDEPAVGDFAHAVSEGIDALGLGEFDLYGVGLGALVALELSIMRPDVQSLIVDDITLLSEQERAALHSSSAISLAPRWDGAHLLAAWFFVRDASMWWPWDSRTREAFRAVELADPVALNDAALDLLRSRGYLAALAAELSYATRARLAEGRVRTGVFAKQGDPGTRDLAEVERLTPGATALAAAGDNAATTFAQFFDGG